jgi:hypothetical protein
VRALAGVGHQRGAAEGTGFRHPKGSAIAAT